MLPIQSFSSELTPPLSAQCPGNAARASSQGVGHRARAWLRWLGGSLSIACALHCALVPLVMIMVPTLSFAMSSVGSSRHQFAMALVWFAHYEAWIVAAGALVTATTILLHGHTCKRIWRWFAAGMVCNLLGLTLAHDHLAMHSLLMISGGICMLLAALRHSAHQH